jgi:hypothetical protein
MAWARSGCPHEKRFRFLKHNLVVPAGRPLIYSRNGFSALGQSGNKVGQIERAPNEEIDNVDLADQLVRQIAASDIWRPGCNAC